MNMQAFRPATDAAQQQLKALGYSEADTVYYRAIGPSTRKIQGKGLTIPPELATLNAQGYGIYLVVNGQGDTDAAVNHGRSIFFEHDDLPKDAQAALWKTLGLPEPTIQIDTGRKSIHSYWTLDNGIPIAEWKILQADLLEFAQADRSIKNPSRVMRLAGFKHQKTREVSQIISNSGTRHSFKELRSIVPTQKLTPTKPMIPVFSPIGEIPLIKCLARNHRELIGSGMGEGGRDNAGASLARDLIGTEQHLRSIGQKFEGNSRYLFDEYCSRCSPPLDDKDCDRIWRSAEKSNPTPCLDADKIQGCIDAHYRVKRTYQNGQGFATGQPIAPVEETEEVEKDEVERALELGQSTANIPRLLPNFAPMLQLKADRFNVPIECFAGALLPLVAASMPAQIRLKIDDGYKVPPILWTGLVGDSGSTKTPELETVSKPLTKLQSEEYARFKEDETFYKKQYKEWIENKKQGEEPEEPQPLNHLYTSDFTIESVVKIVSEQEDRGLAVVVDELAGFFNSFGEHKGGKGGDRQKWLSAYGGSAIKNDRKTTGTLMAARTSISIAGTVQPSILKKLIGDVDDVDGLWPRFLWFNVPTTRMPAPGEVLTFDMSDTLEATYLRLAAMPVQTHEFDSEGMKTWVEWHHWAEDQKINATSNPVRAIYPKARDQAARVALVAHYAEAAIMGVQPSAIISTETLKAAISLVHYCINQARLIYGDLGATDENPEAIRIAKIVKRSAGQELTYKQIRNSLPKVEVGRGKQPRKANKAECLVFMEKLVSLGYATAIEPDFSIIRVIDPDSEAIYEYKYSEEVA